MKHDQPPSGLRGLQKVCRMYGRMKCGDAIMVWDFVSETAVPASEMRTGSEQWKASERMKHTGKATA